MNENNPEESTIVTDLGLSRHYAQLLYIPLRIFSNIPHRSKRKTLNFSIQYSRSYGKKRM